MAKVVIEMMDTEDGNLEVSLFSDPPVPEVSHDEMLTNAQRVGAYVTERIPAVFSVVRHGSNISDGGKVAN